jgi:hypothetical protein
LFAFVETSAGRELLHERLRIGLRHGRGVHLHVAVELRVGVGVRYVGREEYRRHDRLQLEVDARLLARLLDDLLGLLPRLVDRGLEVEPELLAVLGANAVRAALPPRRIENAFAFSTLNSYFMLFERKRSGLLRKFAVAKPVRP